MDLKRFKRIHIGGVEMKRLAIDGTEIWRRGYTNQVPLSINTDGSIYNNGLGYKNGYRVRSGGAEGENTYASCTGFIKVNAGDVVRISGCVFSYKDTGNAINASDGSFTNLGQLVTNNANNYGMFGYGNPYFDYGIASVVEETAGVWKWIVPPAASGVEYIRVTAIGAGWSPPGANLIVTINEEIE